MQTNFWLKSKFYTSQAIQLHYNSIERHEAFVDSLSDTHNLILSGFSLHVVQFLCLDGVRSAGVGMSVCVYVDRHPKKWQLLAISPPQLGEGRRFHSQTSTNSASPICPHLVTLDRLYTKHTDYSLGGVSRLLWVLNCSLLVLFTTGMLWSQWTAILAGNLTSFSLRNAPSYMGSPQPTPNVLQVKVMIAIWINVDILFCPVLSDQTSLPAQCHLTISVLLKSHS